MVLTFVIMLSWRFHAERFQNNLWIVGAVESSDDMPVGDKGEDHGDDENVPIGDQGEDNDDHDDDVPAGDESAATIASSATSHYSDNPEG